MSITGLQKNIDYHIIQSGEMLTVVELIVKQWDIIAHPYPNINSDLINGYEFTYTNPACDYMSMP